MKIIQATSSACSALKPAHSQNDLSQNGSMTLREVLHAHIPTLTTESTVRDAVDKMDVYQFPALVVVNEAHRPVAVVTEGDLCRQVTTRDSLVGMMNEPAYLYGSKDPTIAHPDMEISDAFHRMLNSGLTILPVVDEERLIGVVLRVDLMQNMLIDTELANNGGVSA